MRNTYVDWMDLPTDNYSAIFGYESPKTIHLNQLVEIYNQIPKSQSILLIDRIEALEKVINFLEHWISHELSSNDNLEYLKDLVTLAKGKCKYLGHLHVIYAKGFHELFYQARYHFDTSDLEDKSKTPIFLNNVRYFSIKSMEYRGDFWMESLDPCHRRLTPYYVQWLNLKEERPDLPHFFLWLETQHLPKYVPRVYYFAKEELESTLITVKDGLMHQNISHHDALQLVDCADPAKRYLFAIDLKKKLYIAEESQKISHTSLTSGRSVLGAGLLRVSKGELTAVALQSEHYLPSVEIGYQIMEIFREKEVKFPENLEVIYFHNRNKHKVVVKQQDLKHLGSFRRSLESVRHKSNTERDSRIGISAVPKPHG